MNNTSERQATAPLIIEPNSETRATVIWLHGLGADANDFAGIVPHLPTEPMGIRMVFPNAPKRPVTINQNMVMPAWYDIADYDLRDSDEAGMAASKDAIQSLIDEQIDSGIDASTIVLGGFSQGGAMALHAGLSYAKTLAGVICFSGYLLRASEHRDQVAKSNLNTPILMAHGQHDAVVDYQLAKSSYDTLSHFHSQCEWTEYPMGHEVVYPQIVHLSDWLGKVLK